MAKVIDIHGKPRLYFVDAADIIEGQELLFDYGERRADILEDEPFLKEWLGVFILIIIVLHVFDIEWLYYINLYYITLIKIQKN